MITQQFFGDTRFIFNGSQKDNLLESLEKALSEHFSDSAQEIIEDIRAGRAKKIKVENHD